MQSHEIRFGDAFEKLIEEYLKELGYKILNKSFDYGNGDKLKVTQNLGRNHYISNKWRSELPDTPEVNFNKEPEYGFE